MGVGENVKKYLSIKGMTIKGLSETTGIPLNTLYSITKRDSKNVRMGTLNAIASALNVNISDLLQVEPDEVFEKLVKDFPNAPVTETGDNIRIQIIGKSEGEQPSSEELRRKLLLERYDSMNPQGRLKALDYVYDLSRLPEYKKQDGDPDE